VVFHAYFEGRRRQFGVGLGQSADEPPQLNERLKCVTQLRRQEEIDGKNWTCREHFCVTNQSYNVNEAGYDPLR
jgi:hypothetical protein